MATLRQPVNALPKSEFAPRALVALFLFHGTLQVIVIGTGLVHLPLSSALAWVAGLVAMAVASVAFRGTTACPGKAAPRPARVLALLGALILCAYFVLGWHKTDPSFDGNWYHIPNIHFWATRGYVHWITADPPAAWCTLALDYMNGYPKAHEVTSFWLDRLLGDSALNTTSVLFLPLGALGVHVVCRQIGANPNWSAFAALLYLILPVNVAQIHTTYVDSSFAACVVGLFALMAMLRERENSARPVFALATGIALGLIVGIKGNGPLFAVLAGGFIASYEIAALARSAPDTRRAGLRVIARALALVLLAALATGGYWNFRNWVNGGSPLYPIGITLGGVEIFPGQSFEKIVNTRGQTPPEMRDWPAWKQVACTWLQGGTRARWQGALGDYASRFGGLSFLWLFGALPACVLLAIATMRRLFKASEDFETRALGATYLYLFALVVIAFLLTPNNWWARYTLWIFGIGLPAFVYCASRPMRGPWRAALKWSWVLACCMVFFCEVGVAFNKVAHDSPPFWKPTPGTTYWRPADASPYARMLAESEAPVALYKIITRRQSILGTLCQPIGRRPVYFLSEGTANDPQALAQFVKERGIRYVITGEKGAQPKGVQQLAPEKQYAKAWNINIYAVQ